MKAQMKKMKVDLSAGRRTTPETKEDEPDDRKNKRGREPLLAPSSSRVSRRKVDVGALTPNNFSSKNRLREAILPQRK